MMIYNNKSIVSLQIILATIHTNGKIEHQYEQEHKNKEIQPEQKRGQQ